MEHPARLNKVVRDRPENLNVGRVKIFVGRGLREELLERFRGHDHYRDIKLRRHATDLGNPLLRKRHRPRPDVHKSEALDALTELLC